MNDAQQPLNALPQGHRLQEYELVRVLGFGGFGMTYLGFDHNLDKAVAIKEYLPSDIATRTNDNSVVPQASQFQDDFEWGLDRFLDEARALARFDHRHIIKVHRFFEAHGTAYIVMEYAEGETLSAFLERKGTLTETELKAILYPLLDGLEVVHRADFLHRDIKPGNIIIRDEDNSPVLLDFGSARQAIGARSRSVTSIITPGYAPIEQYSSRGDQGPWTDIYALGGVCYRALTGEVPDDATDRMRNDPLVPVVERCTGQASAEFLSAIDWALRVDESDRPQSIAAWRDKLEGEQAVDSPLHDESSISIAPVEGVSTASGVSQSVTPDLGQQGKRHGKVLLGVLGVCLLLVGLGGYLWWEKQKLQTEIERYEVKFEVALGGKDFSLAGIYVDSIRAVDSDAPMLSELDDRLSKARQAEKQRQEQAVLEKRRQEQAKEKARLAAEQAEKERQVQAALEKQRQEQAKEKARQAAKEAERERQKQAAEKAEKEHQEQAFVAYVGRVPSSSEVNDKDETDLHIASKLNLPLLAIYLLNQRADVNAKNNFGFTPLHIAAKNNAYETAEVLLKYGSDANAKGRDSIMPLRVAVENNAPEMAEILLKHGANVDAKDNYSYTPLHIAVQNNAPEMVEILLKYAIGINARDKDGDTPLHTAVENNGHETAEILLKHSTNVNAKNYSGDTPLHITAQNNAPEMAEILLKHGADVNAGRRFGSPLHTAAKNNAHKTAEVLLKYGADVNLKDHSGNTPLHEAAQNNAPEIAEILLKHGADVSAKNYLGRMPLHTAALFKDHETAEVLLKYGADVNAKGIVGSLLHDAASYNAHEMAEVLLKYGADPNVKDHFGNTPLHVAMKKNAHEIARVLRRYGGKR